MNQIELKSYSKINFGLQVLNKREDGFHNINTIFAKTSLCDKLKFTKIKSDKVIFKSNFEISESVNLILLITKLIRNNYNLKNEGLEIELEKRIPVGGGLGGGSSNAASTIIALNELYKLNLNYSQMHSIATKYGSDIPFFLKKGWAVGKGKGEELNYFEYRKSWFALIVNPKIHISTPDAYNALNRNSNSVKEIDFESCLQNENIYSFKKKIINDFEIPVFENYPSIKKIKDNLYENGAFFALLSGSGASVFGLFENFENAKVASENFNSYFTEICTLLS